MIRAALFSSRVLAFSNVANLPRLHTFNYRRTYLSEDPVSTVGTPKTDVALEILIGHPSRALYALVYWSLCMHCFDTIICGHINDPKITLSTLFKTNRFLWISISYL